MRHIIFIDRKLFNSELVLKRTQDYLTYHQEDDLLNIKVSHKGQFNLVKVKIKDESVKKYEFKGIFHYKNWRPIDGCKG